MAFPDLPCRGDRLRFLLVTGGGLGLAPVAPGTFGSLGGVVLALFLQMFLHGPALAGAAAGLAGVLFVVGCTMTAFSDRVFRRKDPKPFVLDEIVGYLVGFAIWVGFGGQPTALAHTLCFAWFRVFDVLKVFPANRLEAIPGALGIMLDDVMAGVYTGVVLVLLGQVVTL